MGVCTCTGIGLRLSTLDSAPKKYSKYDIFDVIAIAKSNRARYYHFQGTHRCGKAFSFEVFRGSANANAVNPWVPLFNLLLLESP